MPHRSTGRTATGQDLPPQDCKGLLGAYRTEKLTRVAAAEQPSRRRSCHAPRQPSGAGRQFKLHSRNEPGSIDLGSRCLREVDDGDSLTSVALDLYGCNMVLSSGELPHSRMN